MKKPTTKIAKDTKKDGPSRTISQRDIKSWLRKQPAETLVETIYVETAWSEAQAGGCTEALWLELANVREADHAEDAAAIHRRQVEPLLNRKNNDSYRTAANHLDKVHALMLGMGREIDFQQDLLALKTEWKRLRNFIKYVERQKWGRMA